MQNLAPGAAAARWACRTRRSRETSRGIIVCDISGYGEDGPYRDKKAYDLLIQSEAGFVSVTGTAPTSRRRPAARSPTSPPACTRTRNILAALLQRQQTGRGQHIDISMLESLVEWMSYPAVLRVRRRAPPPRAAGASHATIYPYGPFPAGDGKTVMLGLQNEREWAAFCEKVLQQPELAQRGRATPATRNAARRATSCARMIVEVVRVD